LGCEWDGAGEQREKANGENKLQPVAMGVLGLLYNFTRVPFEKTEVFIWQPSPFVCMKTCSLLGKESAMKPVLGKLFWQSALIGVCACVCLWPVSVSADTLAAATGTGSHTTTSNDTFETVTSTSSMSLGGTADEVLVVATFSSASSNTGQPRTATYQLTNGTDDSTGNVSRYLSGNNDRGIGSMVYIFSSQSGTQTYSLQHKTITEDKNVITNGTIVAVPLRTGSVTLNNDINGTKTGSSTLGTHSDWQDVDDTEINVALPAVGDIYVGVSLNSTSGAAATGTWRLQYKEGSGGTYADLGDYGLEVDRSISGASDVGAISLCAVIQDQSAATYYFKLQHKSSDAAVEITTYNVNIAAVALVSPDTGNPSFDTFRVKRTDTTYDTTSSTLVTAIQEDSVKTTSATDMFLHAQYASKNSITTKTYSAQLN